MSRGLDPGQSLKLDILNLLPLGHDVICSINIVPISCFFDRTKLITTKVYLHTSLDFYTVYFTKYNGSSSL